METKFTPGPWHIGDRTKHDDIEIHCDNGGMPCIVTNECVKSEELNVANAQLISEAPELFRTLQRLVFVVDVKRGDAAMLRDALLDASAVLYRAAGWSS
jgi:hypothetical protein